MNTLTENLMFTIQFEKSLSASYLPSIVLGVGVTIKGCIHNVLEKDQDELL